MCLQTVSLNQLIQPTGGLFGTIGVEFDPIATCRRVCGDQSKGLAVADARIERIGAALKAPSLDGDPLAAAVLRQLQ